MKTIPLSILAFLFIFSSNAFAVDQFAIFGDSLTDTGNLASVNSEVAGLILASPIYQNGTFSNGVPAIVEALNREGHSVSTSLHLLGNAVGNNYAVASGRLNLPDSDPLSAAMQINSFLASGQTPQTAVFWIGINDVRDASKMGTLNKAFQHVSNAIDVFKKQMINLIQNSELTKIVLLSIPDASLLPEVDFLVSDYPFISKRGFVLTRYFNYKLRQVARNLERNTEIDIVFVNITDPMRNILMEHKFFGFADPKAYCMTLLVTDTPGQISPFCANGIDLDVLPFVDEIHFSSRLHYRLAGIIQAYLP